MVRRIKALITPEVIRWYVVGIGFTALGLLLIRFFCGTLGWPYAWVTLTQSETCNILRFLVVDRWVFKHPKPTWARLWQYHVANAFGFVVWYGATNALKALGVNYLIAPVLATVASVGVNFLSNFLWIWKKPKSANAVAPSEGS